jgi:hypothetical protein
VEKRHQATISQILAQNKPELLFLAICRCDTYGQQIRLVKPPLIQSLAKVAQAGFIAWLDHCNFHPAT